MLSRPEAGQHPPLQTQKRLIVVVKQMKRRHSLAVRKNLLRLDDMFLIGFPFAAIESFV